MGKIYQTESECEWMRQRKAAYYGAKALECAPRATWRRLTFFLLYSYGTNRMSDTAMILHIDGPYFGGLKDNKLKEWEVYAREALRIKSILDKFNVVPRGLVGDHSEEDFLRLYARAEILVSGGNCHPATLFANKIKFDVVESHVFVPTNNILESLERSRAEALVESPSQLYNQRIEIHMPGNALATYNETLVA